MSNVYRRDEITHEAALMSTPRKPFPWKFATAVLGFGGMALVFTASFAGIVLRNHYGSTPGYVCWAAIAGVGCASAGAVIAVTRTVMRYK